MEKKVRKKKEQELARALTPNNLIVKKRKLFKLSEKWKKLLGDLEEGATIIIYGDSGNGKSRFMMELAKELMTSKKVAFVSLEMDDSLAMKNLLVDTGVLKGLQIVKREPVDALVARFSQKKTAEVIMFDSVQYLRDKYYRALSKGGYMKMNDTLKKKTKIYISHVEPDGKTPLGELARAVKYDADVKIYIKGYEASILSRTGGVSHYKIWEEGANEYKGLKEYTGDEK